MITIKEYNDSFLESLTHLYNLWDGIDDLTEQEMNETIKEVQERTDNKTFMAVDENGKAVGYIFCGICSYVGVTTFLEIIQIMISPQCRGMGVGRLMMDYVTDLYKHQGINQLRLHSRTKLKDAHAFYERLGFHEFKESKFFVKDI